MQVHVLTVRCFYFAAKRAVCEGRSVTRSLHKCWRTIKTMKLNKFFIWSVVFYIFGLIQATFVIFRYSTLDEFLTWNLTQYYVNYFDLGFIKRGLVGTVLVPIFSNIGGNHLNARLAIMAFDFLIFLSLIYLVNEFLKKHLSSARNLKYFLMAIIVISPVGAMQYSYDSGRFDHVNILLLSISLMLLLRHRILLAGIVTGLTVLVHEAAFIYGFPVLLATCINVAKNNDSTNRRFIDPLVFSLPSVMAAVSVYFFGNSSTGLGEILPIGFSEGSGVWSRDLLQPSLNLNFKQYILVIFYSTVPYVFLWKFYRDNRIGIDILFISTLSPIFLFAVGIDYARWAYIIWISVAFIVVYHIVRGKTKFLTNSAQPLKTLFVIYILPLGPIGVHVALPYMGILFNRVIQPILLVF